MSQDLRLQPPGSNALFGWMRHYRRAWLAGDLTAGLVVGIMIIPQSMAYAMLAGLPVQIGLYASILPLIGYALLGSSMTLSVGPVAVTGLMTATQWSGSPFPLPIRVSNGRAVTGLSGKMRM